MFVLIHHEIHDPAIFWSTAEEAIATIPDDLLLHTTISAADGTCATCVWEANSVARVREFVETALGAFATNRYAEAENREGVTLPRGLAKAGRVSA